MEIPLGVEGTVENSQPAGRRILVARHADGTLRLTHWLSVGGAATSPKVSVPFPSMPHVTAFIRAMGWQIRWPEK